MRSMPATAVTPPVTPDDERRADWERWRGKTDALVEAQVDRMEQFSQEIRGQMQTMHADMRERFDNAARETAEIKAEVKKTNGSVRDLKEWRAGIEGQQQGEAKVEIKVQHEHDEQTARRRFGLTTLIAAIAAGAASIGAVATALATHAI